MRMSEAGFCQNSHSLVQPLDELHNAGGLDESHAVTDLVGGWMAAIMGKMEVEAAEQDFQERRGL